MAMLESPKRSRGLLLKFWERLEIQSLNECLEELGGRYILNTKKWSANEGKCYEMFSKRGKMRLNVQQKRENAIKCSEKEGKCYEIFSKRGKMLWNFKQKRENAMKCSPKEGKCYEMFSKGGKMQWNVQQWGKMLWNVQQKRENAIKCSAKEEKCFEMFSKRGKIRPNPREWHFLHKLDRRKLRQPHHRTPSEVKIIKVHLFFPYSNCMQSFRYWRSRNFIMLHLITSLTKFLYLW